MSAQPANGDRSPEAPDRVDAMTPSAVGVRLDPADRPVLVFDGDCGICTTLAGVVERHVRRAPPDFDVVAFQRADLGVLGLSEEQCLEALQWVGSEGRIRSAEDAVATVLLAGRLWQRPLGALLLLPGINQLAGWVYRWVAANRHRLPGGTPACSMPDLRGPGA